MDDVGEAPRWMMWGGLKWMQKRSDQFLIILKALYRGHYFCKNMLISNSKVPNLKRQKLQWLYDLLLAKDLSIHHYQNQSVPPSPIPNGQTDQQISGIHHASNIILHCIRMVASEGTVQINVKIWVGGVTIITKFFFGTQSPSVPPEVKD